MRHLILVALIAVSVTGCASLKRFEQRARRVAERVVNVDVTPLKAQADQWAQPVQYTPQPRLDGACYSRCVATGSTYPYCKALCSY